jgi:adenylate cyclase
MEPHRVERKLAAILSADVKGYSRLMGEDEVATIRTLTAYRQVIASFVQQHRGRVVDSPGDNLLAEFASAVEAVQCAVEIQQALQARNADLPASRRMEFRIGVNLGEVVVEGERLYGEGVNIAARLEAQAEAGGICVSGIVYGQIKNKLPLKYEDLGEQTVKNIAEPVRAWRVRVGSETSVPGVDTEKQDTTFGTPPRRARPTYQVVLAGLLLVAGTIVAIRYLSHPPLNPQSSAPITQEAPALPLPDKPSLVVLPFVNMSKDPEQEYFSDGLTEVLTSGLSRLSGLFVIARNSAFTYKGKAAKVQDIGREMGVRYVLEGSVQRADQRVRIAAQLIEAQSGYHLWSEEYDRPFKDILALQDEIVQNIVRTLRLQLTLDEQGALVHKRTDSLEAYDTFLRGVEYNLRTTKEAHVQAQQMFEKAIALDPQYADAYAALGHTYYQAWEWRWSADPQTLERALAMAQRAIALDDTLPSAHALLGMIYAQKQQYDQAMTESERAIALDANYAGGYFDQAEVLNFMGRSEDALQSVEKALRLNPRASYYEIEASWAYLSMGRYAEAIVASKTLILNYPNPYGYVFLAWGYLSQWTSQLGQGPQTLEQALEAAQRAIVVDNSLAGAHQILGYAYLYEKQYDQALAEMERAVALDPRLAEYHAGLAVVLSYMGRSEEALLAAEQALGLKPSLAEAQLYPVGLAYANAGRLEESVPLFRQYLRRYPNILNAHLILAAVYGKLGEAAERGRRRPRSCDSILSSRWRLKGREYRSKIQRP